MPSIIISTNEDGSATVAPIDATPEMLQDGEQFASVDEAMKAVGEVMGGEPDADQQGGPSDQDADNGDAPPPVDTPMGPNDAAMAQDPAEEDRQMGAGYNAARRGN
jgi:hypothetical protein